MAAKKRVSFETERGNGGETHQRISAKGSHSGEGHLTTNQGIRVSDNQNSIKAGTRGPTLLEDFVLREKIFHFDHERIPERIVHARGSARRKYNPFRTMELFHVLVASVAAPDGFLLAGRYTLLDHSRA